MDLSRRAVKKAVKTKNKMGEARRRAKSLSRKERRLSMDALQIATCDAQFPQMMNEDRRNTS